jgi:hypothetical protein
MRDIQEVLMFRLPYGRRPRGRSREYHVWRLSDGRYPAVAAALTALAVLAAVAVGPAPAQAEGEIDCTPSTSMRFAAPSVKFGDTTTLSWTISVAAGCDPPILELRSASRAWGGYNVSGSTPITPAMLGFGENEWTFWGRNAASDPGTTYPDQIMAIATVNVTLPDPLAAGSQVTISDNSVASRVTFVRAVMASNAIVRVANGVDLDLSDLDSIPVASGVQILGDRGAGGVGPRLFTRTVPRALLKVGDNSDNVRISGIRLEGGETDDPFSGVGPKDSDAIGVYASQHVEIDHTELYHWRGAGVNVHDGNNANDTSFLGRLNQDGVEDNSTNVWVHDNYIHHNQHPSNVSCIDGSGHAGGYGVEASDGAYVKIERNVFDWNRHSIAGDGKSGSGYVARDNLILPNGGVHFKCIDPGSGLFNLFLNPFALAYQVVRLALDEGSIYHTHAIDMHGVGNCGTFGGDHNCQQAGEYMNVEYNTILYTAGNGIHLRGTPTRALSSPAGTKVGMDVKNNVFAHSVRDGGFFTPGAFVQNESGLNEQGNTLGLNTFNDRKSCDFDGDGAADSLIATGVAWWFTSSRVGGQWTFLARSSTRIADIIVRDINGDGRCDATGPNGEVHLGTDGAVWNNYNGYGSAVAMAAYPDGGLEIVGTNVNDNVYHRTQTGAGGLGDWAQLDGSMRSVAAETYPDGRVEMFAVDSRDWIYHRVQSSAGNWTGSTWQLMDGLLRSIALVRYPDGRLEVIGTNSVGNVWRRIQTSATHWDGSTWQQLDGDMRQVAVETTADGRADLFALNAQGAIYHRAQTSAGTWAGSAWQQIPGELNSIAVARNGAGTLEAIGANRFGNVWHMTQSSPGSWAGAPWQLFDGSYSQLAANTTTNGRIELFAVDAQGSLAYRTQSTAGSWAGSAWTATGGQLRPTRLIIPRFPLSLYSPDRTDVVNGLFINAQTTNAYDGTGPYRWSVTGLPPGLSLDPNSGMVTGRVTTKGIYRVTTTVSDSSNPGATVSSSYTWTVLSASCWGRLTDHRVLAIPDLSTVSVNYANGCPGNGSTAATIAVDISHTYIGDLIVDLIAPSGRVYNLHNRAGGSSDNLVKTYTLNLSGEPVEGIWTLRIQDAALADTGQLNSASLTLQ